MNANNKRKHERFGVRLTVDLKDRKGRHPLPTGNISRYGLFMATPDPKPQRQLIQMVIVFPHTKEEIEVMGQVMWSSKTGGQRGEEQPGMGIKFFSMPEEHRKKWEEFVEQLRSGKLNFEDVSEPKPEIKEESASVVAIGEEELEELDDLDLGDLEEEMDEAAKSVIEFDDDEEVLEADPKSGGLIDISGEIDRYEEEQAVQSMEKNGKSEDERRVFPRKLATFMIRMSNVEEMREFYTRDISLGGLFLKTDMQRKVSEEIRLVIVHPWTAQEFSLPSEVARIESDETGQQAGLGIRFVGMNDLLQDSLLIFIETGFVVERTSVDIPAESDVLRTLELIDLDIKDNPIDDAAHFKAGMLALFVTDREKAREHLELAEKLGHQVPAGAKARLQHG